MQRDPVSLGSQPADPKQMTEDQLVRKAIRTKEFTQIKELNKEFDDEEEELKRFFQEGVEKQKTVQKDPTLVKKQKAQDKTAAYKEIANTINVRKFMSSFYTHVPPTPEEQELLNLCRRVGFQLKLEHLQEHVPSWSIRTHHTVGIEL